MSANSEITQWLKSFEKAINQVDYEAGIGLFHPNAFSFGSKVERLGTRDELLAKQWSSIWPAITDFEYVLSDLNISIDANQQMAVIGCLWKSKGYNKNNESYLRPGRVTFLLRKEPPENRWLCYHSHHSLTPVTPGT